jgi:hypothetical protein
MHILLYHSSLTLEEENTARVLARVSVWVGVKVEKRCLNKRLFVTTYLLCI